METRNDPRTVRRQRPTTDARTEIRAVYGGFGVTALALALAGMAAGRSVGIAVERSARAYPTFVFLVIEIAAATALAVAANGHR